MPPVVVEPDPPARVEAMTLAGHRHVLLAGQPQAHRATRERGTEGGHCGESVRLHLLAAEAAAHPQALHRHPWLGTPSTWAVISWVSVGCWVLDCTNTWPFSSTIASEQWVSR